MNRAFFDFEKIYPPILVLLVILTNFNTSLHTQPTGFSDELLMDGWSQAVGLTFDANGKMYVWEKSGKVWVVDNGIKANQPLVDISEEVGNWRDFGLVGFALDPNFLNNGHIYLWYVVDRYHLLNFGTADYNPIASSEKEATIARLTRYTANISDNFSSINYDSRKVLIGETKSTGPPILHESHGAGDIVFGTDGTLIVTIGDGASYTSAIDEGSHPATYYQQALADGIITEAQNIGAYRCQSLNNLSGKILRIDPLTGNGVPSNPYYDPSNPRSPQSRIWSLGVRNPYRIALKPESGSHNINDGRPGVFFFGDVGWSTWEELNVINAKGQNFGWPNYEGITQKTIYNNPNYAVSEEKHTRPIIDWRHGADQARGVSNNIISTIGSHLIQGKQFRGNASTGGVWYDKNDFPKEYQQTYFHADYSDGWIKNIGFDEQNEPTIIKDFITNAGAVVYLTTSPIEGGIFYVRYPNQIRKISYTGNANKKPIILLETDKSYGASPLAVQFDASNSFDPEYSSLSYHWDFDNGQTSNLPNPSMQFQTNQNTPTTFSVKLTLSDAQGASSQKVIPISLNNTPPVIISTSIDEQNTIEANKDITLNLNAVVTDAEHNGQLKYEWQTSLFHNGHSHAEPIDHNPATTTHLSPLECNDGSTYWYRITLVVTDPEGLSTTFQKDIFPACNGLDQIIDYPDIPDQSITEGSFFINVSVSSGLPISTYLVDGPAMMVGNKVVFTGLPGKITVRATQGGNAIYKPAKPIEKSFRVLMPRSSNCESTGNITRDVWMGDTQNSFTDGAANVPPDQSNLLNDFEARNSLTGNMQLIRGYICPPVTGLYTFWVSSEEDSQLWLSTNSNAQNKKLIASVKGTTRLNQWNKYASQQSAPILLVAGGRYYIHASSKGGKPISVGWKLPDSSLDRPISGQYLSAWHSKKSQTLSFFGIPDKLTSDPPFLLNAFSSSNLPIDYKIISGPATVAGNTLTLTGLAGEVLIQASQKGNEEYAPSNTVERRFEVTNPPKLPSIIIDDPIPGSSFLEPNVRIKYTLSGDLGFYEANHLLVQLDDQAVIDVHELNGYYDLADLPAGEHNVKFQIADKKHQIFTHPEASANIHFNITTGLQGQSINFYPIPDKLTSDIPFPISATATSGLPVTLKIISGPAIIDNNILSLTGTAGTVVVEASQEGNQSYSPATSIRHTFTVKSPQIEKQPQSIHFPAIANKVTTDLSITTGVTATSGLPVTLKIISGPAFTNNNIVFLIGEEGTVIVEASQAGNENYLPAASIRHTFEVIRPPHKEKLNQTIHFSLIPNKVTSDLPFAVEATATSGLPISFEIEYGPASVDGNIITLDGIAGIVIVRARQLGNEKYKPAPSFGRAFSIITSTKGPQYIQFSALPDKLTTAIPFSITASSSSGLPVTFSVQSGPASIAANIISLNGTPGTVIIRASQQGNTKYLPATHVDQAFQVTVLEEGNNSTSTVDYCSSRALFPWQEWIENVSFASINHTSFKDSYGDFLDQVAYVNKNESYSISVKPSFSWIQWNEYIKVWIDYNQNGRFDDVGEQVLSGISLAGEPQSVPQPVEGVITIPITAKEGETRMRVSMKQAKYANPCDNFQYGEVEDYSIFISSSASDRAKSILSFSAYPMQEQDVKLEWISNGDWEAKHYEIERSSDNLNYYKIEEVAAEKISIESNFYALKDKAPLKGNAYYRIKQVNKDGSFIYSNIEKIHRSYGVKDIYLYPNPVKEIVHINVEAFKGLPCHFRIFNAFGQLITESKFDKVQSPTIRFNLNEAQNGIYYLYIKANGKEEIGRKFVLNRNY